MPESSTPSIDAQWEMIEEYLVPAMIAAPDLLTSLCTELLAGPGVNEAYETLRNKFYKGAERFDGQWLTMSLEDLSLEAYEEAQDLLIYLAMMFVIGGASWAKAE